MKKPPFGGWLISNSYPATAIRVWFVGYSVNWEDSPVQTVTLTARFSVVLSVPLHIFHAQRMKRFEPRSVMTANAVLLGHL